MSAPICSLPGGSRSSPPTLPQRAAPAPGARPRTFPGQPVIPLTAVPPPLAADPRFRSCAVVGTSAGVHTGPGETGSRRTTADNRTGVAIVGLGGAVATTAVAGVEMMKLG